MYPNQKEKYQSNGKALLRRTVFKSVAKAEYQSYQTPIFEIS
jgi:hypothetical protein